MHDNKNFICLLFAMTQEICDAPEIYSKNIPESHL